jgi:hypothetical protein
MLVYVGWASFHMLFKDDYRYSDGLGFITEKLLRAWASIKDLKILVVIVIVPMAYWSDYALTIVALKLLKFREFGPVSLKRILR